MSAPAIFSGAILNQDYSQNKPSSPAPTGSVIQIFLTGLPATGVTGKIHDRDNLTPYYAGPAPGFVGVQQVNLVVPADLPSALPPPSSQTQHPSRLARGTMRLSRQARSMPGS